MGTMAQVLFHPTADSAGPPPAEAPRDRNGHPIRETYGPDDITTTDVRTLGHDHPLREQFVAWVSAMTSNEYNENGPDTARWLEDQLSGAVKSPDHVLNDPTFASLFGVLMIQDKDSGAIIATVSIAPDDRGVLAENGMTGAVTLALNKVDHQYRERGLEVLTVGSALEHVEGVAAHTGRELAVVVFDPRDDVDRFWVGKFGFVDTGFTKDFQGHLEIVAKKVLNPPSAEN